MWKFRIITLSLLIISLEATPFKDEESAKRHVTEVNKRISEHARRYALADWNFQTNLTDSNLQRFLDAAEEFVNATLGDLKELDKTNWKDIKNSFVRRQYEFFVERNEFALPPTKYRRLQEVIARAKRALATTKICSYADPKNCKLTFIPDLANVMSTSRDPEELKYTWLEWRKALGSDQREYFKVFVEMMNEAARVQNLRDASDMLIRIHHTSDLKDRVLKLWNQVKPLYLQLHAYVRFKLREKYGEIVSETGPIPIHLLGTDVSSWASILDVVSPTNQPFEDITRELIHQKYTPLGMFKTAEDFLVSMNFTALPRKFWDRSVFVKVPDGPPMVCDPSYWNFFDGADFRIMQCTSVNHASFMAAHKMLGIMQYFMSLKNLPLIYQVRSQRSFYEAVGNSIALSVSSNNHLFKFGFLKAAPPNRNENIKFLLYNGLMFIPALPTALVMETWRWDAFSGKFGMNTLNGHWWKLRNDFEGVEPPVDRGEDDFDPVARFHMTTKEDVIRTYLSVFLGFQFFLALCTDTGSYRSVDNYTGKPLHECDLYGRVAAGNALADFLQVGGTESWDDAIEVLIGTRNVDARPLLEYFGPLMEWLVEENERVGAYVGWTPSTKVCTP